MRCQRGGQVSAYVKTATHFPTQRACVVQVHANAEVGQGQVWGWVEHMVSGQATYCQTMEERAQFMVHVLTSEPRDSQASEDMSDT